jgi:hypothetical protein
VVGPRFAAAEFAATLGLELRARPQVSGVRRLGLTNFGVQALLGGPQPRAARAALRELGRQLVATRIAESFVVGRVSGGRLFENLPGDLLVAAVRIARRVPGDLRAVDRDQPDANEPGVRAQPEHLGEDLAERQTRAGPGSGRASRDRAPGWP